MSVAIIGVDPHKRSHTAVVLDECEEIASQIRVSASAGQVDALLGWAPPERLWAVENANGLGRLLAQQLVARGETVVDVPAPLACRARKLSGRSGRKTDEFDARSVAIAARHNRGLRRVTVDDPTMVLALLLERRWQLVAQRQRALCQLHALLTDMVPAGAKRQMTSTKATQLLRSIAPAGDVVTLQRKVLAREMLTDIRDLDRRIPAATKRLEQALDTFDTTLTDIVGISTVGAATILSIVGYPNRFATSGTSPGSPAPHRCRPPRATSNATGCRDAATARSTRCCTPQPWSRSACVVLAAITTTANDARARAPKRRCARSSGSCPTSSTAGCSPTTSARWPGADR